MMFTTSEIFVTKKRYEKVGLLRKESFKSFQTNPSFYVYVEKMNEKTKYDIRYKHKKSRHKT